MCGQIHFCLRFTDLSAQIIMLTDSKATLHALCAVLP